MKLYKGNIVFSPSLQEIEVLEGGCIAVDNGGRIVELFRRLPEGMEYEACEDFGERLLIPAFTDLHIHSSQLPNRGLGYDQDFESWLNSYTYPMEKKYADPGHTRQINAKLIEELAENGIMHAVVMSSTDREATQDLIKQFQDSGLCAYIGKMNSDISPFGEPAETTEASIRDTLELIHRFNKGDGRVRYILSPEFIPCCSEELLRFLGKTAEKYGLAVQSHYAEGEEDVRMVREMYPHIPNYGRAYRAFGLFGQTPTVMAHSIFTRQDEVALMAESGVLVAHCPLSNLNIPSGKLMPLRRYLDAGITVGLGSDIAGGHTLNVLSNMVCAIQTSKQMNLLDGSKPIGLSEAFYLATRGGGSFFEETGSFEKGFFFDALVLDDVNLCDCVERTPRQRLERLVYAGDSRNIVRRYCRGKEIRVKGMKPCI